MERGAGAALRRTAPAREADRRQLDVENNYAQELGCITVGSLPTVVVATAQTRQAVFQGATSERKRTLKELNPDLPRDWSGYEFLVLELRITSPQKWSLQIYDAGGARNITMHPFGQNVWLRASVPLKYFLRREREGYDHASIGNKPANSFWMGVNGAHGPLTAVEALGVAMQSPLGNPTLEIRNVHLAKEDPGSEFLEKLPVVDEFGQWIHADWPGKAKNLEQLRKEWTQEEKSLKPGDFNYCKYGGYLNTKARATGFFRVEQIDGKWWFVDPDGHLFLGIGVPGMGAGGGDTRVEGREKYYAALPPDDLLLPATATGRGRSVSFRSWNLLRRFGEGWRDKAAELESKRMEDWGLTVGESFFGAVTAGQPTKPYLTMIREWQTGPALLGMPDVYSEEFPRMVDQAAAKALTPRKNDPYLLGFYIGNELPWPGREADLLDMILEGKDSPMQRAAKAFLAVGDTPARRKEFAVQSFQKYVDVINAAVKKYDPNHLNLGLRFAGVAPDEVARIVRVFNVFSFNVYGIEPTAQIKKAYELTGRPILIGEFHFGVPANGLAAGIVQVRDQRERGVGYRYYLEQAAALPGFVGSNWFVATDESVTGRMDGENYAFGWVDVTDRPYYELVNAARETHKRLFAVHSGKEPPFNQRPIVQ